MNLEQVIEKLSSLNKLSPEEAVELHSEWILEHIHYHDKLGGSILEIALAKKLNNAATAFMLFEQMQVEDADYSASIGSEAMLSGAFALMDRKRAYIPDGIEEEIKKYAGEKEAIIHAHLPANDQIISSSMNDVSNEFSKFLSPLEIASLPGAVVSSKPTSFLKKAYSFVDLTKEDLWPIVVAPAEDPVVAVPIKLEEWGWEKNKVVTDMRMKRLNEEDFIPELATALDTHGNTLMHFLASKNILSNEKIATIAKNGGSLEQKNIWGQTVTEYQNSLYEEKSKKDDFVYSKEQTLKALNLNRLDKLTEVPDVSLQDIKDLNKILKRINDPKQYIVGLMRLVLTNPAIKDIRDEKGNTALHYAIAHSHKSAMRMLVKVGFDPLAKNALGQTVSEYANSIYKQGLEALENISFSEEQMILHVAASEGDVTKLKEILALKKVSVNGNCFGSALEKAAGLGHSEVVKLLIENGAFRFDQEALHSAIEAGHVDIVKILLQGATVTHGNFPHMLNAIKLGNIDLLKILIDHGAVLDGKRDSTNPFPLVAKLGRGDMMKLLVKSGANIKDLCESEKYSAEANSYIVKLKVQNIVNKLDFRVPLRLNESQEYSKYYNHVKSYRIAEKKFLMKVLNEEELSFTLDKYKTEYEEQNEKITKVFNIAAKHSNLKRLNEDTLKEMVGFLDKEAFSNLIKVVRDEDKKPAVNIVQDSNGTEQDDEIIYGTKVKAYINAKGVLFPYSEISASNWVLIDAFETIDGKLIELNDKCRSLEPEDAMEHYEISSTSTDSKKRVLEEDISNLPVAKKSKTEADAKISSSNKRALEETSDNQPVGKKMKASDNDVLVLNVKIESYDNPLFNYPKLLEMAYNKKVITKFLKLVEDKAVADSILRDLEDGQTVESVIDRLCPPEESYFSGFGKLQLMPGIIFDSVKGLVDHLYDNVAEYLGESDDVLATIQSLLLTSTSGNAIGGFPYRGGDFPGDDFGGGAGGSGMMYLGNDAVDPVVPVSILFPNGTLIMKLGSISPIDQSDTI